LRKLEFFFGFLITVMAITFGYEVLSKRYSASACWSILWMICLSYLLFF
jgi:hypothetical protein